MQVQPAWHCGLEPLGQQGQGDGGLRRRRGLSIFYSYNILKIFFWNQNFQFPNMICVNAGQVSTPVTLLAGQAFEASLILQVM